MSSEANTYEEFFEWIKAFEAKHKGYFPNKLDKWWKRCEESHKGIRNKIGGIRKQCFYSLTGESSVIDYETVRTHAEEITAILPRYLPDYGFDKEMFTKPTFNQGSHNVFKTSKHIRTYAEQALKHSELLGRVDKSLAKLGEVWAKNKTSKVDLEVTISTSPKSFVLLGHYGPDADSCFRNGSDKTNHKFVLGQTVDTFVVSIAKRHPRKDKLVNIYRTFGWASEDYNIYNVCNPYLSKGSPEGDMIEAHKKLFSEILGYPATIDENKCVIDGTGEPQNGIFNNPYGKWSFARNRVSATQILYPERNLIQLFRCENCGYNGKGDRGWDDVDHKYVCPACLENSLVCEVTSERTFRGLISAFNETGTFIDVHPNYARQLRICSVCATPSQRVQMIDDQQICPSCVETLYEECDECQETVKNEDMSEIGDRSICNKCLGNGVNPYEMEELGAV